MARNANTVPVDDPIGETDVTEGWSSVITFAPGHPMRGTRCAACGKMIAGRRFRHVTLVSFRHHSCTCGAVPCATYLVCAEHPTEPVGAISALIHHRFDQCHGGGL